MPRANAGNFPSADLRKEKETVQWLSVNCLPGPAPMEAEIRCSNTRDVEVAKVVRD